jgi:leucyl aminopeptidase
MGGLLGVNRGSSEPPRFIELVFEPSKRARATVALVGKGITFDSGGLSIKTADGMTTMKDDMGGAAAVLGAFSALRAIDPPVRVLGYIPTTDNMIGADATRPGDVLRIRNGKTVEVLNTDAEGRLILADALSMAAEAEPDVIIDVATLTGACQIALGNKIAGLMSNNPALVAQLEAAAERTGERVWELPLPVDYRRQLNSDVADVKNVGPRFGGALLAGLFLQDFVPDDTAWAHLDIAGPAWSTESEGILTKGGTGFGVRLLLETLRAFQKPT